MRRLTAAILVFVALSVGALTMAVGAGAESGPRCADITGANWNYATRGSLNFGLILDGAATTELSQPCRSVTYTLIISGISGPPMVVIQKGNHQFLGVSFTDTDDIICVSATAGSSGGKVHDAAPDAGCLEISVGTTGAGGGFN